MSAAGGVLGFINGNVFAAIDGRIEPNIPVNLEG